MIVFALDASTPYASLALLTSNGKIRSINSDNANSQIETISELFTQLLEESDVQVSDLNYLLIGNGPGSFTGLRIAYSFISGLSSALEIPVIEIDSFRAQTHEYFENAELIFVVSDARRDEVFCSVFYHKLPIQFGNIENIFSTAIIPKQSLPSFIRSFAKDYSIDLNSTILISDDKLDKQVVSFRPQNIAQGLIQCLNKDLIQNSTFSYEKLSNLQPNYLRAVAARKISERLT